MWGREKMLKFKITHLYYTEFSTHSLAKRIAYTFGWICNSMQSLFLIIHGVACKSYLYYIENIIDYKDKIKNHSERSTRSDDTTTVTTDETILYIWTVNSKFVHRLDSIVDIVLPTKQRHLKLALAYIHVYLYAQVYILLCVCAIGVFILSLYIHYYI